MKGEKQHNRIDNYEQNVFLSAICNRQKGSSRQVGFKEKKKILLAEVAPVFSGSRIKQNVSGRSHNASSAKDETLVPNHS